VSFLLPFRKPGEGPILRSARIILRPPAMDDFKAWVDLRKTSRNFLQAWEPEWSDDEFIRASFRYRLHMYNKLSQEDRGQALFIFNIKENAFLGAINVSNIRRGVAQMATLGYWIGQPFANQGFMAEALHTLMPYLFSELKLNRVEAACLPHNVPSIAVLKKLGFEQEGLAKQYLKIAGRWEDHLLFARLTTHNRESQ
jgi:[ribosomal protein S5]-alanine N-acetyltransferase